MIKKLLVAAAVLTLTACPGRKETVTIYQGHDGVDGRNAVCTASRQEVGVLIACNDGSNAILLDGSIGPIGLPGADASCSVSQEDDGALISCSDGSSAFVSDGSPGNSGHDGSPGNSGHDGASCSVSQLTVGALITCGNSSATVYNGTNGTNGSGGGSLNPPVTYSSTSCTSLGNGYYGKSGSGQYTVYTLSSCSNSSKVATMDDSSPTFWLSSLDLLVFADPSSVRKITF